MNLSEASYQARQLLAYLTPACERAEIAGSIRRGNADVKDIEIVCIPKPRPRPVFGDARPFKTELDALLYQMSQTHSSQYELKAIKGGDKYKQFLLPKAGINLDLFICTPPAQFGVQFVIRTGPADFSQWVVTQRSKGGALPDGYYVKDGAVWRLSLHGEADESIEMPSERDFLEFLGIGWVDPSKRVAKWRQHSQAVT